MVSYRRIAQLFFVALSAAYLGYANAASINHMRLTFRHGTLQSKTPFIPRDEAFNLKIHYERSTEGTLETYLTSPTQKIPIHYTSASITLGNTPPPVKKPAREQPVNTCAPRASSKQKPQNTSTNEYLERLYNNRTPR